MTEEINSPIPKRLGGEDDPPDLVVGDIVIPGSKRTRCDVYSRVMGYLQKISDWNVGKQSEWKDRKFFEVEVEDLFRGEEQGSLDI